MNFHNRTSRWAWLPARVRGMFNLNDPRWGRGEGKDGNDSRPDSERPPAESPQQQGGRGRGQGPAGQPPDLDELWRDLNRKLGSLFGGRNGGGRGGAPAGGGGGNFQPDMKHAWVGLGLIVIVAVLIWLGTGVFIVQEGQQAVVTRFGKFDRTVNAGLSLRWPYPIENHEIESMVIRPADIGSDRIIPSTGLRDFAMLTEDENIVEIKFSVQYRVSDVRAWRFESDDPAKAVVQAAETAVREVVGKMKMDSALADERDQIAPRVRALMQSILDRYNIGVEVVGINLQQSGVQPPKQVQGAFDDVLKAGQERERAKNQAQAYANDVVPRAVGKASRLMEEAAAYKARIVAHAQGDTQRFSSVLAEYQKAPQVTRDRMYLEAMQQIYSGVTKVLVDSRQGSNLLYLPLDKIMQSVAQSPTPGAVPDASSATGSNPPPAAAPSLSDGDSRARDTGRTRERESR